MKLFLLKKDSFGGDATASVLCVWVLGVCVCVQASRMVAQYFGVGAPINTYVVQSVPLSVAPPNGCLLSVIFFLVRCAWLQLAAPALALLCLFVPFLEQGERFYFFARESAQRPFGRIFNVGPLKR